MTGPRSRWAALVGLFVAVVAVLLGPGLFSAGIPVFRDLLLLTIPLRLWARQAILAGELPLWTPDLFFGAPFFANYQSAVLYPPSAILYFLPFPVSFSLYLGFHLLVASLGMTCYLQRRAALGWAASIFGGSVFAFGGFVVTLLSLVNQLQVAVWLPWALEASEAVQTERRPRDFVRLTLLLTLQGLGGAPEAWLMTIALVAANTVRLAVRRGRLGHAPAWVAAAALLAFGLAGAQLLPTAEYAARTSRIGGLSLEGVAAESLEMRSFLQLLIPHSFLADAPFFVPEGGVPVFWSLYVSALPLVLAALAMRWSAFWTAILVTGIVLALGSSTPLLGLLHQASPRWVGAFRFPPKAFLLSHVAISVLAASGLDLLLSRRGVNAVLAALGALAGFGLLVSAAAAWSPEGLLRAIHFEVPPMLSASAYRFLADHLGWLARRLFGLGVGGILLVWLFAANRLGAVTFSALATLLTVGDLLAIHQPSLVFIDSASLNEPGQPVVQLSPGERVFHYCTKAPICLPAGAPGIGPWNGTLRPGESVRTQALRLFRARNGDVPMLYGAGAVAGSDGFSTVDQQRFFRMLALLPTAQAVHLLAALGVQRLVGPQSLPDGLPGVRASDGSAAELWDYVVEERSPRSYLAERLLSASNADEALVRMAASDFRPGRDAVLAETLPGEVSSGSISEAEYRASRIRARLSLTGPGLWVVSDTWYPGWKATIDGAAAEVIAVNGFFRGVRVPAGDHRLEMVYAPASFQRGMALSTAAALALLVLGAFSQGRGSAAQRA